VTVIKEEAAAEPEAVAAAAPAEPEVVKKGKQDEEAGGEAPKAGGKK
jgi:hypothetical protein